VRRRWGALLIRLPGPAVLDPDEHASILCFDRLVAGQRVEEPLLSAPKPLLTVVHWLRRERPATVAGRGPGSGGETRTRNNSVNSRALCQLSYPGMTVSLRSALTSPMILRWVALQL
jgi:hypothetical protein